MGALDDILAANDRYAAGFTKGDLATPPTKRFAVLTCMDARLDPARFLGLEEGDAHVIRNAGAIVTDDVLRSLAISHHLLGTREVFVIAHEGCGMLSFENDVLYDKVGDAARGIDFLPFSDLDGNVRDGVRRIRESALLPDDFDTHGLVYDVGSGRLREVA